LGHGGTAYFTARSDLSTLFEDLALVRPTELNFVPRIWDMLFGEFQSEVDRRSVDGADRAALEAKVMAEMAYNLLGGRFVSAMTGSAPISAENKEFVEAVLDLHLVEGYGSTEAGIIYIDGQVRRPAVIDYKLIDVPDLGYYHTDQPYPRGELLVKTRDLFPGYYKRPEVTADVFDPDGYYRTGDVVAEVGPDHLVYLDRRMVPFLDSWLCLSAFQHCPQANPCHRCWHPSARPPPRMGDYPLAGKETADTAREVHWAEGVKNIGGSDVW